MSRRMRIVLRPWLAAVGLLAWHSGAAWAQGLLDQVINPDVRGLTNEPGVTVTSRDRPDYAPLGVRVGNFLVRPTLSESVGYDDNVTGTSRARGSSFLFTRLDIQAGADLSRYGVAARLTVDDLRYFDVPAQSLTNWTGQIGGTYNIGRDTASASYSHANYNQTPRDLSTPLLDATIAYRIDTVRLGYATTFNRLSLRPELTVSKYDFDDGSVGGVPLPQRFRNRVSARPGVVANYELAPRRNLVVAARNTIARYTDRPAGSSRRDFNDTSVLAGVDFDAGGLWRYRVLVGYGLRTFSDRAFKTIQAPIFEGTVIYTPTGLTTVTGAITRRIQDSASEATEGFTETAARLTVDHEYLRNVLLRTTVGVALSETGRGDSQQTLYTAGAGATWLLNRNARLSATYDFATRQSSGGSAGSFNQGLVGTGLSGPSLPGSSLTGSNLGGPSLGGIGPAASSLGGTYTGSQYLLQLSLGL